MRGLKAKAIKRAVYSLFRDKTDRKAKDPKTGEIFYLGPKSAYRKAKKEYMKLNSKARRLGR